MWKFCYQFMLDHPGFGCRAMWWFLRRSRILDLFCDEGYLKIRLLGRTGERFASAEEGGGINSLVIAQMLYWKSKLPTLCCDKFAVREFVRARGLGDILVPLVPGEEKWDRAEDIPWERLPSQFVLKCNNGSALRKIVYDKSALDPAAVRRMAAKWLKSHFGRRHRERHYAGVTNCLFAEELLPGERGPVPVDYKIMCSNGRPLFCFVVSGRFQEVRDAVYDLDWKRVDVTIQNHPGADEFARPRNWERMLEIASILSKGIPIVRIDLYNIDGRIYFGEMTFTPCSAIMLFSPFEFSNRMARLADPICRPKQG